MELHCLTLDKLWLECLNTQTVKGRSTVHKYRVTLNNVLKDAPDNRILAIDYLLCTLYGLNDTTLDELTDDKWLVELCCHILWNTHLVHSQLWTYDDN